jgi:hypothetical protein
MSSWDDEEESTEFRDIPDETQLDSNGQPKSAPASQVRQPVHQPVPQPAQIPFNGAKSRFEEPALDQHDEQFLEELLEESEEDFSAVFNDANLRIEQGKLYQMIMNHDLFDGMDADPKAVQNVQKEIRKFARERMEIMLGMRQEQVATANMVSSPFNDLEVDILKKIASKATNGATETEDANEVAAAVREVPKRRTLNPIGGSTGLKKTPAPAPQRVQPKPHPQRALPTKPAAPITRTKNDQIVDQILAEEGLSRADLELEYVGIGKRLDQLTAEELAQRQKATAARMAKRKTVRSESAIPMATPEQQELLALQRATQFKGVNKMDGLSIPGGMSALLDKVKSMPVKNSE